ncbi:hypothetical protein PTNB73_09685 [Pyrenophora teres f. teres]|nr:hypothetical protein HRS9122_08626 [Pyrenophora teres f. teres]KAE8856420.1 hypothetical protein PTNB73_09685 [Pyrenophora teres f. teres]
MKAAIVAAALAGSAVAAQHNRHMGFHMRRGEHAADEVCTVYHTVYVTGLPPMSANSTMAVPPTAPKTSTTCTESSSGYVPGVPASTPAAATSSAPPNYPAVPASSKPVVPEASTSFAVPSYPPVDYSHTPGVPASSTSCTEEENKPTPEAPKSTHEAPKPTHEAPKPTSSAPVYPAVPVSSSAPHPAVPTSSKPVVPEVSTSFAVPSYPPVDYSHTPGVPASSTSCTEEENKPTPEAPKSTHEAPKPTTPAAPVPESSKPAYPVVPVVSSSAPAYPVVPVVSSSAPAYPVVPVVSSSAPAYPVVPVVSSSAPAYPVVPVVSSSAPAHPVVPVVSSSAPAYPVVPVVSSSAPAHPVVSTVQLPSFTPAVPTSTSSKPAAAKPTPSSSKPSGNTPNPNAGSYGKTGRIVTNGDKWSMTYTPYASDGQCMTPDAIAADIKKIAKLGFTTIRIYATDCGVFEHVVPACHEHSIKIIYGVFLEGNGKGPFSDHANEQVKDIIAHAPKDSVAMVIVGNEALFNNVCSAEQLGAYIDHVRNQFRSAGFPEDIAFTTAEPVGTWEEKGAALCSHIDVFCAQIHPFFTATIEACDAGDFVAQQLDQASKVCPEAAARGRFVSETGWPSHGNPNGKAVPSQEQQNIAIKSIIEKVGSSVCLLGLHNDMWKPAGEFGVENWWGVETALAAM